MSVHIYLRRNNRLFFVTIARGSLDTFTQNDLLEAIKENDEFRGFVTSAIRMTKRQEEVLLQGDINTASSEESYTFVAFDESLTKTLVFEVGVIATTKVEIY